MAEVASYPSLNALLHHRDGMQVQRQRLESILQKHGANAWAHTDQAMQTLVIETAKMASMLNNHELRDAGPHRIGPLEHYKIAAHGTAAALAGQLGLRVEQRMLHESLEEENKADALLRMLAKGEVNQDAVAVAPI